MDSEVTASDEDSINATYRGTLMAATTSSTEAFYNYRSNITKVVFEDKINPKETELSWDVSEE